MNTSTLQYTSKPLVTCYTSSIVLYCDVTGRVLLLLSQNICKAPITVSATSNMQMIGKNSETKQT